MSARKFASRIIIVVLALVLAFSATAPVVAHAQSATATSIAHTYSGTYTINGVTGLTTFTLLRGIQGGYEAKAKINSKIYYAVVTGANGFLYVNIFRLDKNYNQVHVAQIKGKLSADLTMLTGRFEYMGKVGKTRLLAR